MSSPTTRPPVSARPTRTKIVLVADALDAEGLELLRREGLEVVVRTGLSPGELAEAARDVDALLVRSAAKVTAEVFAAARRLSAVGRAGTGVDTIDVAAASRKGVLVMNTPDANTTSTAELALAHLFALARKLPAADASMKAGRWDKKELVGSELTGKTLLVIGLGRIGRAVAERALGLRMRVLAADPHLRGESPVPGVPLVDLDEGLAQADAVTIHVPGGRETASLLGRERLARLRRGALLVNCARGGIVDEAALLEALESGQLGGAALDVFTTEPLPADSPLRRAKNLQLTPHLGASSAEAQQRVSSQICEQMADWLLRGVARGAVNAPAPSPELLELLRPWTALAERCGLLLAQLAGAPIAKVEITYLGELCERPVELLRLSALAGVLAPSLDGPVNLVNAALLAGERGLAVLEERCPSGSEYTAALRVTVETASGARHAAAGTVFHGLPRLVSLDGFGVDLVPAGELLLTHHRDAPGVLGQVATWLGARGVNIDGLHMGAPEGDTAHALALYRISRALEVAELAELEKLPPIVRALGLSLADA